MKQNTIKRKNIRLKQYDYTLPGAYFITICTNNRKSIFGEILNNEMHLNKIGNVVKNEWISTFALRPKIRIDEFIIMPNHFHAILWFSDLKEGTARRAPTNAFSKPVEGSLSSIIRSYKAAVTRNVNLLFVTPGEPVWQRGYYEHVIRKDESLDNIRLYIVNNPINWLTDPENPNAEILE